MPHKQSVKSVSIVQRETGYGLYGHLSLRDPGNLAGPRSGDPALALIARYDFTRRNYSRAELYVLDIRKIQDHIDQLSLKPNLDATTVMAKSDMNSRNRCCDCDAASPCRIFAEI